MKLIIATKNRGKILEIETILAPVGATHASPLHIQSLLDFPNAPDVIEDGTTFEANALKKTREICRWSNQPTLADDSGIVVPALAGEPGVHSARYAGAKASDQENLQKLMRAVRALPPDRRQAYYACVMALVLPDGREWTTEGRCEGELLLEPRGTGGFGYDPIFYLPELGKTMAELPLEIKNKLSHRGRALDKMKRNFGPKGQNLCARQDSNL